MPAIALGELYYGARKSARAAASAVLACDAATAAAYGEIKAELRARGTPIPENDLWIAALARHHRLTLVCRDAHFSSVPDLKVVAWNP